MERWGLVNRLQISQRNSTWVEMALKFLEGETRKKCDWRVVYVGGAGEHRGEWVVGTGPAGAKMGPASG